VSEARLSRFDRLLVRLDAALPPPQAWFFALRIWIAMMLALYVAFWLQLSAAEIKRILSGRDVPSFTSTMVSDPTRRIPGTKKPRAAVPAGLRRSYWSAR
jgi:hypothetical protein